ncbi:hypothetical protein NM688_g8576 [Phlebia brevispora]|uniref:Uncharacterized protein n=1 Tax=Phlebia brevispora TaxID=194682 RepID=A0ACC1RQE7_9APHY|nr:hypothetical protein NM688_g8576 [Phlebia brevispora]
MPPIEDSMQMRIPVHRSRATFQELSLTYAQLADYPTPYDVLGLAVGASYSSAKQLENLAADAECRFEARKVRDAMELYHNHFTRDITAPD